jgi:hypothetical protein
MHKHTGGTQDSITNYEEIFPRGASKLTPYQIKRGKQQLSKLCCVEYPEEHIWIYTCHPEKAKALLEKYKTRQKNIMLINKFDDV